MKFQHDADQRSKNDFFMEASAMGQFDDLNVIHLEGVITKSKFPLLNCKLLLLNCKLSLLNCKLIQEYDKKERN